jgi:dynein heavy chain
LNYVFIQVTSGVIGQRLKEAETTEAKISVAREKYRVVATRGSVLYFVIADMAEVDPMYQFSLKYFKQLFNNTISNSEKADDLNKRLDILLNATTCDVYRNIARGLFEKDKLVFSFMLCVEIMKTAGSITSEQWNFFLRGSPGMEKGRPEKPDKPWLTHQVWNQAFDLQNALPAFKWLHNDLLLTPVWIQLGDIVIRANPETDDGYGPEPPEPKPGEEQEDGDEGKVKGHWDKRLTSFQKLIFLKVFKVEKVNSKIIYIFGNTPVVCD